MAAIAVDGTECTIERRTQKPAHLFLKIGSFSSLYQRGIKKFESMEFAAGDYKWRLVIYPDGEGSNETKTEDSHISVYLALSGTCSLPEGWRFNAICSVFLYDYVFENYVCFRGKVQRFSAMRSICGFSKLIPKKIFIEPSNGFLVDDNCVFGAEIFVISKQRVIECVTLKKDSSTKKFTWTISNFSQIQDVCSSEMFLAGGCKWMINLYPKGNASGVGRNTSIYLHCMDLSPDINVNADISLRIKNQLNDNYVSCVASPWFKSSACIWGCHSFVQIGDFCDSSKGLVGDDQCIVEVDITVIATA